MLDQLRGRRAGVLLSELVDDFQVTERQVRRDLLALDEAGHLVEIFVRDGRSAVRLIEKSYREVVVSRRERYALLAVRRVFDALRDTPFYEDVESVYEKLLDPI